MFQKLTFNIFRKCPNESLTTSRGICTNCLTWKGLKSKQFTKLPHELTKQKFNISILCPFNAIKFLFLPDIYKDLPWKQIFLPHILHRQYYGLSFSIQNQLKSAPLHPQVQISCILDRYILLRLKINVKKFAPYQNY